MRDPTAPPDADKPDAKTLMRTRSSTTCVRVSVTPRKGASTSTTTP